MVDRSDLPPVIDLMEFSPRMPTFNLTTAATLGLGMALLTPDWRHAVTVSDGTRRRSAPKAPDQSPRAKKRRAQRKARKITRRNA